MTEVTEASVVQFRPRSVLEGVAGATVNRHCATTRVEKRRGEGKGEKKRRDRGLEVEHCGRRSPGRFQCTLAVQAATARPLPRRTPAGGHALESAAASWGSARSR